MTDAEKQKAAELRDHYREINKTLDELQQERAVEQTYQTFCETLDELKWTYTRREEKRQIVCQVEGESMPIDLILYTRKEKPQTFGIYAPLPFTVPEERKLDMACAISAVNIRLAHGCFDYDLHRGTVTFRIQQFQEGIVASAEVCRYLVECACQNVDELGVKLFMLSRNKMTLDELILSLDA